MRLVLVIIFKRSNVGKHRVLEEINNKCKCLHCRLTVDPLEKKSLLSFKIKYLRRHSFNHIPNQRNQALINALCLVDHHYERTSLREEALEIRV